MRWGAETAAADRSGLPRPTIFLLVMAVGPVGIGTRWACVITLLRHRMATRASVSFASMVLATGDKAVWTEDPCWLLLIEARSGYLYLGEAVWAQKSGAKRWEGRVENPPRIPRQGTLLEGV